MPQPPRGAVGADEDHLQELQGDPAPPQAGRRGQPENALAELQEVPRHHALGALAGPLHVCLLYTSPSPRD
eukprot:4719785-Alexandrium_andersonii.AAC.1